MMHEATNAPSVGGPLEGVRVLDLSGFEGMYGGRLLADLGADVVRVETVEPSVDHPPGPMIRTRTGNLASAFTMFANLNKRAVRLDLGDERDHIALQELINSSDIVIATQLPDHIEIPGHVALVETSIFGNIGDASRLTGSDLIGLASGGLLSLGGYPDTPPVAVYGNQAYLCGGLMTGVAAVLALLARDVDPTNAPHADVSVQATVVGALEDATAEFDLCGTVRQRAGDQPREAGTGIFRSADGYIAVVAGKLGTSQAWLNLVQWLQEAGAPGAMELSDPEWTTLEKRREHDALMTFMTIFESFTITKSKDWLYREGQRRSIAIAPVNSIQDIFHDPQLNFRNYFCTVTSEDFDSDITVPGKPYRLFDFPVHESVLLCREVDLVQLRNDWSIANRDAESAQVIGMRR